jgi:hypothetical protein
MLSLSRRTYGFSKYPSIHLGVTSPSTYVGPTMSFFAVHVEGWYEVTCYLANANPDTTDSAMSSVNMCLRGCRIWYGVARRHAALFEKVKAVTPLRVYILMTCHCDSNMKHAAGHAGRFRCRCY